MNVIEQERPGPTPLPGIAHTTYAGRADGLTQLSLWRQTLAPGAGTPLHRHDCDEVVLCLAGRGELQVDGRIERFGADSTVVLPAHGEHRLCNVGDEPLELLGIFAATPVVTRTPDGQALELPWRT